jgi:glucose/arabinose dehydrogenase
VCLNYHVVGGLHLRLVRELTLQHFQPLTARATWLARIVFSLLLVSGLVPGTTSAHPSPVAFDTPVESTPTTTSSVYFPMLATGTGQPLYATRIASGIQAPTHLTTAPGDTTRLFVTSQYGRVRILRNGAVLNTPFLDIADQVACCGERGLLSLAFHPNYAQNGYFYVAFVNRSNQIAIVRYHVSGDPDEADPNSAFPILIIDHPPGNNHYGGQLQFGPDGYLYIGTGDGADPGDPYNNSQNTGSLLGKILRIDIDRGSPYAIPPTNPFAGPGNPLDEIWSLGLRNPWRFSFDPLTNDLWIGDVGQQSWEEVNFEAADNPGGRNYGWDCYEGTHNYSGNAGQPYCQGKSFTWPVYEYPHTTNTCAVTGGYVYRASTTSPYYGTYVFADFCNSNRLYTTQRQGAAFPTIERSLVLPAGQALSNPGTFGRDANGQLYVVDWADGDVFLIQLQGP